MSFDWKNKYSQIFDDKVNDNQKEFIPDSTKIIIEFAFNNSKFKLIQFKQKTFLK